MKKFTLLEQSQIFGDFQLDIFKKYGVTTSITDFAILLGGYVDDNYKTGGNDLEHRNGWYWNKTSYDNNARTVSSGGYDFCYYINKSHIGCRPILLISSFPEIGSSIKESNEGVIEIDYGEYPQKVCNKLFQNILEGTYLNKSLKKTGKCYTVSSCKDNDVDRVNLKKTYVEYEYNGKKYIRVIANTHYEGEFVVFSNGEQYKDGDVVWVEVSPVKWLLDKKTKIMVAKHILFAGIEFNHELNYTGDFDNTDLGKYLQKIFANDIIPSKKLDDKKIVTRFRNEIK